ncbi:MAG: prepilin-type N-terminal cleavage/methylation domain-containing protein [bacterium]|nr:prepilin-type N-terminal cleavage/methylation domain-containing protein [bacterium]
MKQKRQQQGFTLIEILISLTILAMIMAVTMGGFRLGTSSWETGTKRLDEQQRMRCVFDILIQDIKSCLGLRKPGKYEIDASGEKRYDQNQQNWPVVFLGEAKRVTFITTASGIDRKLKKGSLRLVSYYLSQDENKPGLVMEESPWLGQDIFHDDEEEEADELKPRSYRHSLYPDVVDVTFRYYGVKKPYGEVGELDAEPQWYDDWNLLEDVRSGEGYLRELPEKIEVTIQRKLKEGEENREERQGRQEAQEMVIRLQIPIPIVEQRVNAASASGQ